MIGDKKVLAVLPARGGSKGVPGKNIKQLAGNPLIKYTINAAQVSKYIDRFIVSTDSDEIAQVALAYGADVPFIRPSGLATDDTPGLDVIFHAITECQLFDVVMILQPTSPFRTSEDIDQSLELYLNALSMCCVSVEQIKKHPAWCFQLSDGYLQPNPDSQKVYQRQQFENYYSLNGAVYIADIPWLEKNRSFISTQTLAYIMPAERSLDIDSIFDFHLADLLMKDMLAYDKNLNKS